MNKEKSPPLSLPKNWMPENWPLGNWSPERWKNLTSLRNVLGVYLAYCLVNIIISLSAGPILALDDVKLNVLVQNIQIGYLPDNPPLYEWLLFCVQQVTGPVLLSFLIVKYSLMTLSGALIFLNLEKITNRADWSFFGAIAFLSLFQIGWNYHQAFTHSLTLIAAILFFLLMVQRLLERPTLYNYGIMGGAVGVGLLAKYSFPASLLIIFAAAFMEKENRRILFSPKIILSLFVVIIMFTPHVIWLLKHQEAFSAQYAQHFGEEHSYFVRLLQGFPSLLGVLISFFLPTILFTTITLRKSLFSIQTKSIFTKKMPWFFWSVPFGAALMMLFVIVLGLSSLEDRYAIAFLLPSYLVFIWFIQRINPPQEQFVRCLMMMLMFIVLWPTVRVIQNFVPGSPFCDDCRQWVPYDGLEEPLAMMGVKKGSGDKNITLVGFEDHTAGNLRRLFPRARIVSTHLPFYVPPDDYKDDKLPRRCIFIWSPDLGPMPPKEFLDSLASQPVKKVVSPWRHALRETGWRETTWNIIEVPPDNYAYLAICARKNLF